MQIKWMQPCCIVTFICMPRMGYVYEVSDPKSDTAFWSLGIKHS